MNTVNFLESTINALVNNNKTIDDVLFVRNKTEQCSFIRFAEIVNNFTYINSFGCHEIDSDLVVVGKDGWWLERFNYDGTEYWVFKTTPTSIKTTDTLNFRCDYCSGKLD